MTNLNEVIAKAKGFQKVTTDKFYRNTLHKMPDYQGDANLYMPLYFDLPTDVRMQLATVKEDELGKQVCLAWLKMKGIEI